MFATKSQLQHLLVISVCLMPRWHTTARSNTLQSYLAIKPL